MSLKFVPAMLFGCIWGALVGHYGGPLWVALAGSVAIGLAVSLVQEKLGIR
jgi:ABC-type uncharacterized transport system permease subunit